MICLLPQQKKKNSSPLSSLHRVAWLFCQCKLLLDLAGNCSGQNRIQPQKTCFSTIADTDTGKQKSPILVPVQAMKQRQSYLSEEEQGLSSTTFNTGQMRAASVLTATDMVLLQKRGDKFPMGGHKAETMQYS